MKTAIAAEKRTASKHEVIIPQGETPLTAISFVIPTYNEEKTIERALLHISKYLGPHETIISDGGSTDRTLEIARKYTDKIVYNKGLRKQTIAEGRNNGAFLASNEFIVEMDADTRIPNINKFFAAIVNVFNRNPKVVGATTWFRVYPQDETFLDRLVFGFTGMVSLLLNNYFGLGCTCGGEFQMIRTKAFRRIGGYNESLVAMEDVELFSRLKNIGRIYFAKSLSIYHSGRRAHILGWSRSILIFIINGITLLVSGNVRSKMWQLVR